MYRHNVASRAWEQLCALIDRPIEQLKESCVSAPLFNASNQKERLLCACGCLLTIRLGDTEISASITNESVPAGRLPSPRKFSIEGLVVNPQFVEQGDDPRDCACPER